MNQPEDLIAIAMGLGILVGVIECFFGYRIFRVILALTGFLFGSTLAGGVAYAFSSPSSQLILTLLGGVIGGLMGAGFMFWLYHCGLFLLGVFLGSTVGASLVALVGRPPSPVLVVGLGLAGGVAAILFQRLMIIVSTGFGGAWSAIFGIAFFAGIVDPRHLDRLYRISNRDLYPLLLAWVSLGSVGVLTQYRSPRKKQT